MQNLIYYDFLKFATLKICKIFPIAYFSPRIPLEDVTSSPPSCHVLKTGSYVNTRKWSQKKRFFQFFGFSRPPYVAIFLDFWYNAPRYTAFNICWNKKNLSMGNTKTLKKTGFSFLSFFCEPMTNWRLHSEIERKNLLRMVLLPLRTTASFLRYLCRKIENFNIQKSIKYSLLTFYHCRSYQK